MKQVMWVLLFRLRMYELQGVHKPIVCYVEIFNQVAS